MPWTHLDAWHQAAASDKLYLIVRGQLLFDADDLPEVDWERQDEVPPLTRIDAVLAGQQLSRLGFQHPFERAVTLEIACFGPWCPQLPPGAEVVGFVEIRGAGELVLQVTPCGGDVLLPSDQVEADLARCMRGGHCPGAP